MILSAFLSANKVEINIKWLLYHCDSNAIIAATFNPRAYKNRLLEYDATMKRLKDRNMLVYIQTLDKEASTEYKRIIKDEWGVGYQLVPPHIHHRNTA